MPFIHLASSSVSETVSHTIIIMVRSICDDGSINHLIIKPTNTSNIVNVMMYGGRAIAIQWLVAYHSMPIRLYYYRR
jgi:hypothetical protein